MAKFHVNEGFADYKLVEADHFAEQGSLIVFKSEKSRTSDQVYAIPTSLVKSIERAEDSE